MTNVRGGGPARATELATVLLTNGQESRRGVYILDGLACFITEYNKTKQVVGHGNVIARFVPRQVTELVIVHATVLVTIQQ